MQRELSRGPGAPDDAGGPLARLGFADAARAERMVGELRLDDQLIGALGAAADPDLALTGLARLLPPGDGLRQACARRCGPGRRSPAA